MFTPYLKDENGWRQFNFNLQPKFTLKDTKYELNKLYLK